MISATERQQDALRFIVGFQQANGFSPSRQEIGEALNLASKSGAQRLINGLADRGAIRVLRYRDRAIDVLVPIAIPRAPDGEPLRFVPIGGPN